MKLVEQGVVVRKMPLQESLGLRIIHRDRKQTVTREDASRVRVGNKERLPTGIEEDGICGFGSQALDLEELATDLRGRQREERVQGTATSAREPLDEIADRAGLLSVKPCRFDARFHFAQGRIAQSLPAQSAGLAEFP
jgi:hypothetical protein